MSRFSLAVLVIGVVLLTGCTHRAARTEVPPPPAIEAGNHSATASAPASHTKPTQPKYPPQEDVTIGAEGGGAYVETGIASWYGPPYHNRRAANGEVYDMNALTAAHRTLPLGTVIRVTNPKTKHSVVVRITDRGPFIEGRMLDLSLAAARKVDVWGPGTATVRIEVLQTPAPIDRGGRWAVQIGGFGEQRTASQLCDRISRRYHTAKVQEFNSPTGAWWVRVRVPDDDKHRAEELARGTSTPEGGIFLVRLD
ncbi:MAG TPA: septal ring lytic transglycosylase RlpA family protein [Terriglobales bacterium]|nr:septal ring lytic transglycosylase RlpA family protein [Terriglobales bacterium]